MLRRFCYRKFFLFCLSLVFAFFIIFNIHYILLNFVELNEHVKDKDVLLDNFRKPFSDVSIRSEVLVRHSTETTVSHTGVYIKSFDQSPKQRPWYMSGGAAVFRMKHPTENRVFPEDFSGYDRIPEQLMISPTLSTKTLFKKILLWNGFGAWSLKSSLGRGLFVQHKCPINSCVLVSNRKDARDADLIVYKDRYVPSNSFVRPINQIWMIYMLECPRHTGRFNHPDIFNWTATYRTDSTIVTPYERWQYYDENVKFNKYNHHRSNYALNKTKTVAWFVSNCKTSNKRMEYATELKKYINVDIYGACGNMACERGNAANCFKMLREDYKFYLAFENSNCRDYITEKLYVNGLSNEVIPIVMGAREEEYRRSAPYHSYIHVDAFDSPKDLAEYLHQLDQDDELYNEYFQWKGTGEFIDTKFFCRMCHLIHNPKTYTRSDENQYYRDINSWWAGKGTCIKGSWRKYDRILGKKVSPGL